MKKVLTVLAILVVLTSAIFAETHKLKIQATSAGAVPVFQMTLGSVTTNDANKTFGTENNSSLDKTASVADTFDWELGGSVKVIVKIQNPAKTKQNYLLTFGDGVFKNIMKNDAPADDITYKTLVTTEVTGTGYKSTGAAGIVTVDFDGTRCTADSTITEATYTYDPDATIDPGTYSANLELVITTTT